MLVVAIYGKVMLYKYVSCWVVGEGACIVGGKATPMHQILLWNQELSGLNLIS